MVRRFGALLAVTMLVVVWWGEARPAAAAPIGAGSAPAITDSSAGVGPSTTDSVGGVPCLPVVGCDPLGRLAGDGADAIGRAVFAHLGSWVAEGAGSLLDHLSVVIRKTTTLQLDASWFTQHFKVMRDLAALLLLPLVVTGVIGAVIHRDPARLGRAFGFYLPAAVIGGAVAVQLTLLALAVTDQLSASVAGGLSADTNQALQGLAGVVRSLSSPGAPGVGGLLGVLVMLLLIAGALVIWIELLLRSSAIYVVVLFLPIALTGLVWPVSARWTRRVVETLVALILSKFIIVAVISLAAGMIAGGQGLDTLMAGAALLMLAAFAPFALLRLAPLVEAGVIGHLEGMERRPVAVGATATMTAAGHLFGMAEGTTAAGAVGASSDGSAPMTAPATVGGQLNGVHTSEMEDSSGAPSSSRPASESPADHRRRAPAATISSGPEDDEAADGE